MTDRELDPDALDRLLAGEPGDDALTSFLGGVRTSLSAPVDGNTAQRHMAAIVAVAQEHAHTVPTGAAPAPTTRITRWRGRLAQVFGYTATKIALGVGVAAAATGGLAATDSLPEPVQGAVSNGFSHIGVDFPHPDDLDDTPVEELPTLPSDEPSERSDDTRGATVDAPQDDAAGNDVPEDDVPADEAPVDEVPADDDAPPVDTPADEADSGEDADDDHARVDTDDPPSDDDEAKGIADDAADEDDVNRP